MPVRKVSRHRGSAVGQFPSMKMNRMIAFESLLERDFIYLLDYDPRVTWFEEQPVRIEYMHEEKHRHYTPDFLLLEQEHHVLVECKPERFVDAAENSQKFVVAQQWCQEKGWPFRIVTEQEIRAGYRLQNVQLLTRYARQPVDPAIRGQIAAVLRATPSGMILEDVVRALPAFPPDRVTAHLLQMAYQHQLTLSLDPAPISAKTILALCGEPQTEVTYA